MDLAKLFQPTSRKLWFALIAFFVLPGFVAGENTSCDPWYAPIFNMEQQCVTNTTTAIAPFFGIIAILTIFMGLDVFIELLPFLILQVIISYVVACIVAEYFLKQKQA